MLLMMVNDDDDDEKITLSPLSPFGPTSPCHGKYTRDMRNSI